MPDNKGVTLQFDGDIRLFGWIVPQLACNARSGTEKA